MLALDTLANGPKCCSQPSAIEQDDTDDSQAWTSYVTQKEWSHSLDETRRHAQGLQQQPESPERGPTSLVIYNSQKLRELSQIIGVGNQGYGSAG